MMNSNYNNPVFPQHRYLVLQKYQDYQLSNLLIQRIRYLPLNLLDVLQYSIRRGETFEMSLITSIIFRTTGTLDDVLITRFKQ